MYASQQNKPIGLQFLEVPFSITKRGLPKRRKNYCQNAEKITAKTPKKLLPKRRKNYCQNAEKIIAKTPKKWHHVCWDAN